RPKGSSPLSPTRATPWRQSPPAAACGLRQGEVFGLTVPKVSFLRDRSLNVAQQLITGIPGRPPYLAPPKRNSVRTVPASDVVLETIARHLEIHPSTTQLENLDGTMEYLVYTDLSGRLDNRRRYGDIWRKARAEAGLPDTVTFHDLL